MSDQETTPVAPRRVVVAEDESLIRLDIVEILRDNGFEVVGEAGDGETAVRLAAELKPDLVVMDVKMPILDGISAAERKVITDAANEAKDEQRKLSQAKELQAIDGLRKSMQVNDVTPAELVRLRQKVAPVVEKFAREVGDTTMQQVNGELARMRGGK